MPTVGNISSPVLLHSGDAANNVPSSGTSDLAQSTRNINQVSRVTPTQKAGEIQQISRNPRSTPPDMAEKVTQESRTGRTTPKEDQVSISENARSARSPEPIQTGENVGGLNVESKLDIKV
ncbi:MAG: hypothetical protein HQL72_00780 [Magnetococcales bacterium]|nr:hypothetical protein [Magnetococcales bacterium]